MSDLVTRKKSKHVASSARIFATGLTATAVLGLTSTLALAKPSWSDSSAATSPDTTVAALTAPAPSAPAPAMPGTTVPATNTPANNNNQSPVVVNVPVPVPPSNGNNTSAPTQSNGS